MMHIREQDMFGNNNNNNKNNNRLFSETATVNNFMIKQAVHPYY
jgi:hypothetical protein